MEEEMTMTVEGQGEPGSSEGESGVDMPTSPTRRARGRPKGSKKLQVWVTQVDLSEFGTGISNGGSVQPLRSRGRPKGSGKKHKVQKREQGSLNPPRCRGRPKGSGLKKLVHNEEDSGEGPKGYTNRKTLCKFTDRADDWDFTLDNSFQPKKGRGRPKGSGSLKRSTESSKSEEEEDGYSGPPRKRGRPKGSPNKKPRLAEREVNSEWESLSDSSCDSQSPAKRGRGRPRKSLDEATLVAKQTVEDSSNGGFKSSPRGRGRPRKDIRQSSLCSGPEQRVPDGPPPAKRGPGRPKGSPNKTYPLVHRSDRKGRPRKPNLPFIHTERLGPKPKGRGRPKKEMHKRGRPRKNPLPPAGDLRRPKVWKPLGRPRKYPKLELPESPTPPPRRARGRPRKVEIKRGFNLRKAAAQPTAPNSARPRPRGHPPDAVKDAPPRKRGRPKGSVNKPKVASHTWVVDDIPAEHQRERRRKESHDTGQAAEEDTGENDGGTVPAGAAKRGVVTEDM